MELSATALMLCLDLACLHNQLTVRISCCRSPLRISMLTAVSGDMCTAHSTIIRRNSLGCLDE